MTISQLTNWKIKTIKKEFHICFLVIWIKKKQKVVSCVRVYFVHSIFNSIFLLKIDFYNPYTQMATCFFEEIEIRNLENWLILPRDLSFKMNGKLNCSSYTSLFLFKVTLKIEMWVSKIHFSFFTEIQNQAL